MSQPIIVSIHGLSRSFGDVRAVAGVDLDIFEGEFITLLGPSGSGKTTVLRMIAGFEKPDAGTILLSGKDVSQLLGRTNACSHDLCLLGIGGITVVPRLIGARKPL